MDSGGLDDEALRNEFCGQTARLNWEELQTYYARGLVVEVNSTLDVIDVAVQLTRDNVGQFEQWIASGQVVRVTDDTAQLWFDDNVELWTLVAPPWILVQLTSQP
ncbi:MAG: hypothetical protein ACI9GW_002210 [Halieaceae bacterium]|jgi:hypothetical protein